MIHLRFTHVYVYIYVTDYSFSSSYVSVHTNGDSSNLQHDHHYVCGVDTVLICVVINDNANGLEFARWVEYSNGHSTVLTDTHFSSGGTTTIQYKLDNGGYYSCQYNKYVQFSKYAFNLTVEVVGMVIHVILMFKYSL